MSRAALEKLQKEIESQDNNYVKYIGDYLINYIRNNPKHAENILKEDKTILGSLKHMEKEAKKKAKNGMAILADEEGFKAVLEYYEIQEAPDLRVVSTQKKVAISLDDLL